MGRILLSICAVVVAAGLGGNAQPIQDQTKAEDSSGEATATAPPNSAAYAPYPDLDSDACYQAENHDSADLCAQWRAAFAAEESAREAQWATNWSIAATALSGLALGALIWTLIQTERSLSEARRGNIQNARANARATRRAIAGAGETAESLRIAKASAAHAAKQVKVSELNGERRLRAYVAVESLTIGRSSLAALPTFTLTIRNTGATPAHNVTILISGMCLPKDADWNPKAAEVPNIPSDATLHPNAAEHVTTPEDAFEPKVFSAVAGGAVLMVYGRIEYDDVFKKPRETRFCHVVDKQALLAMKPLTHVMGNWAN